MNDIPQAPDDTISLLDLVSVIVRRKWLIIVMTATVAIVTLAVLLLSLYLPPDSPWNLLPNTYKPTVRILLQDTTQSSTLSSILNQSGLGALTGIIGSVGGSSKGTSSDLAKALLASRFIQDQIAEKFDFVKRYKIQKNPKTASRQIIISGMKVKFDDKTGILEIGYEDIDPVLATDIVSLAADLLQKEFKRLTMDKVISKKQYLEESIAATEKEAAIQAAALVAFQNKHGIYDLTVQAEASINAVAAQQGVLVSKQVDLQLKQKYLPETDVSIIRLKNEIATTEKLISQLKEGGTDITTGTVPQNQIPALGVQYLNIQREMKVQEAILSVLKQQYETSKLEVMDTSLSFEVFESAELPETRSGPARAKTAMIATVAGFFVSILIAFIAEYFQRAKRDPVEAEKLSAIRASFALPRKRTRE
jgi:tyrosine-protein kinase Etk/Wzc